MKSTSVQVNSVVVIESLPEGDYRTGTELFDNVINPMASPRQDFERDLIIAKSHNELMVALDDVTERVANGCKPILQLEAHGAENQDGLVTGLGESVPWEAFTPRFQTINRGTGFNLILQMSACSGVYYTSQLLPTGPSPAWAIIGPRAPTSAAVLLDAYSAFYREMFDTMDGLAAFRAMKASSEEASELMEIYTAEFLFIEGAKRAEELLADERVEEIGVEYARAMGYDLNAARAAIRGVLAEKQEEYERLRDQYFMIDTIPENRERFDFTWDQIVKPAG